MSHHPHRGGHHRDDAPSVEAVILTASDTRSLEDDRSGALAEKLLREAGHRVRWRRVVREEAAALREALREAVGSGVGLVLVTGGTGVGPRDRTPELVAELLDTPLPGFGEAFRRLSWEQVGALSWSSRALAGLRGAQLLVALPGSPGAVRLALEQVLLPALPHVMGLCRRRGGPAAPEESE